MSRLGAIGHRLYTGELSYDIVGQRRRWYVVSAVLVGLSVLSLLFRGVNTGIEFTGGADFQVPSGGCTLSAARSAVADSGATVSHATELGSERFRITTEPLTNAESLKTKAALAEACAVDTDAVDVQVVGPSWGGEITKKAVQALIAFLVLVSLFLAFYFTWQMAVAALVALIHDIVITIGVYSILQFEVTPSTVVGILTILGYSLYDTVVVFDKVKENTRGILGQSRYTYGQSANLAVNQTLVRSVNTSVVALLPVAAILFVGAGVLGAGTLKDLSLALFVGIAAGTYSSVFIATPFLVQLMERDPQMQALSKRVAARGGTRQERGGKRAVPAQPPAAPSPPAGPSAGAKPTTETGGVTVVTKVPAGSGGFDAGESEVPVVEGGDAMERARARRKAAAAGPRHQPKRSSRSKRR